MTTGLSRRSWTLDAGLALVLALIGVRYTFNGVRPTIDQPAPGLLRDVARFATIGMLDAIPLAVLAAAPLALRRRFPLLVLWLVSGATVSLLNTNPDVVFVACIELGVAIYSATAYSPHRLATLASLPVAAILLVVLFQNAALPSLPNEWVGALILLPIAVAATGIRARRQRNEQDRQRRAHGHTEALRAAVEQERARIARELHDVVTHHVSMMVIQAGAARTVLTAAPDEAREALLAVEAAGRTALGELRGVLGLLTAATTAELAPQPGLDAVPDLVTRVREAGVPVDFTVTGEPRPIPEGIGLAAYRVVQEALTNTVKHAAGASASVVVEYGSEQLWIEITDAGSGAPPAPVDRTGYGLAGLRERVAVYGGTLHTGPRLIGGYRVRALLPLELR